MVRSIRNSLSIPMLKTEVKALMDSTRLVLPLRAK